MNRKIIGLIILLFSTFISLFITDWIIQFRKSEYQYILFSIDVTFKILGLYLMKKEK